MVRISRPGVSEIAATLCLDETFLRFYSVPGRNEKFTASPRPWPKKRPPLTDEQQRILRDWYQYWFSEQGMHGRFSQIDEFGHRFAAQSFKSGCATLEIGPGNGGHLRYENLERQSYTAMELDEALLGHLQALYPSVTTIHGDCQAPLAFPTHSFDRVLAIHVLEHLDNLPAALSEVHRVLRPDGTFSVVIPCEGGLLYSLGRRVTSARLFERRYRQSYDWVAAYDHVNTAREVLYELKRRFSIRQSRYFPCRLPAIDFELVIGLTCSPIA